LPDLKLAKIPDRTPVKIAVNLAPDLHQLLADYADIYRAAYGRTESVTDLVPHMLQAFLEGDRGFLKARREREKGKAQ
jgi:hypothetical protein